MQAYGITIDVDWATEMAIMDCAKQLSEKNVKATFFATHKSDVLKDLENDPLFEIGLHPNYYKEPNVDKAITDLKKIYPDAISVRSHGLYSSSNIQKLYLKHGFKYCSEVFVPKSDSIPPYWRFGEGSLVIIPYHWEDANYFTYQKQVNFDPKTDLNGNNLKIFNFHPVHVFANTNGRKHYEEIKKYYHDDEGLLKLRSKLGVRDYFQKLVGSGHNFKNIKDFGYEFGFSN